MKKHFFLCVTLFCLQLIANAQSWHPVGADDSNLVGYSTYQSSSTAINGIPYVAFGDESTNGDIVVQKYINDEWETVGTVALNGFFLFQTKITTDGNGILHLLSVESNPTTSISQITVRKFVNDTWILVGNEAFVTANSITNANLLVSDDGTPYVSYNVRDDLFIFTYKQGSWSALSMNGLTINKINNYDLAINNNELSLCYINQISLNVSPWTSSFTLWTMKFDGTTWGELANEVALGASTYSALDFKFNDGIAYIAYRDHLNGTTSLIVKRLTGNNWTNVGTTVATLTYYNVVLQFDNQIPMVAYSLYNTGSSRYEIVVSKLNDSTWDLMGQFVEQNYVLHDFNISNGRYFIGYQHSEAAVLREFNVVSSAWDILNKKSSPVATGAVGGSVFIGRTPYISSYGADNAITVRTFDGNSWQNVGSSFPTPLNFSKLYVHNNELYLMYYTGSTTITGSLSVRKWTGTTWTTLGFNSGVVAVGSRVELAFTTGGNIYQIYRASGGTNGVIRLYSTTNNSWSQYLSFSGSATELGIAIYNGTPYSIAKIVPPVGSTQLQIKQHTTANSNITYLTRPLTEAAGNYNIVADDNSMYFSYTTPTGMIHVERVTTQGIVKISQTNGGLVNTEKIGAHKLLLHNGLLHVVYASLLDKKLYIQRYVNSTWEFLGNQAISSNLVTQYEVAASDAGLIGTYTSLSSSIFSKSYTVSTLPVVMGSFVTKVNSENKVSLTWNTLLEANNAYFTVLRSSNGQNYHVLTTQRSNGDSGANYNIIDYKPFVGTNYYKLIQTDNDGNVKELGIKTVKIAQLMRDIIVIYPNPVKNHIVNIKSAGLTGEQIVEVLDSQGKRIIKTILNFSIGEAKLQLNQSISPGVYLLKLHNETLKLIVD